MSDEKIYCGSVKEISLQNGKILKVSLNLSELLNQYAEHGYMSKTGKKMMTLKISERREVGQYGETHTVMVDTWKPVKQDVPAQNYGKMEQKDPVKDFQSDIPF